jgi:hypothetical protein
MHVRFDNRAQRVSKHDDHAIVGSYSESGIVQREHFRRHVRQHEPTTPEPRQIALALTL